MILSPSRMTTYEWPWREGTSVTDHGLALARSYGVTDMVSWLLTTFPIAAVMITFPPVVRPVASRTVPADTVAKAVLLEVQVATLVTTTEPLHVTAVAVSWSDVLLAVKAAALVGI